MSSCKSGNCFKVGDKVKIVNSNIISGGAGAGAPMFAINNLNSVHTITKVSGDYLYFSDANASWVYAINVEKVCEKLSVACLEKKVSCLRQKLACAESRLAMLKELEEQTGSSEIDPTEFKIYAAIHAMKSDKQSDIEKARAIAHIIKSC